jgi:hypothetical protein
MDSLSRLNIHYKECTLKCPNGNLLREVGLPAQIIPGREFLLDFTPKKHDYSRTGIIAVSR